MKFLFTLCLFLPFLMASSHKSHQNQNRSLEYVGYQPASYSLSPKLAQEPVGPIPRFISNTNNDFKMKRIFNPIQLRQVLKLNPGMAAPLKYTPDPDSLSSPTSPPEFSNNHNSVDNSFPPKEWPDSFMEAPVPKKSLRSMQKSSIPKAQDPQESGEEEAKKADGSKEKADKTNNCDCLGGQVCPPCDYSTPDGSDKCRCAFGPEMVCPSCNVGKAIRQIHEAAQKEVR